MLNRICLLFTACLLTAFAGFSQGLEERLVPLHFSDQTDLIHFRQNGYILSLSRSALIPEVASQEWMLERTAILATGDTLDFKTVDQALRKIDLPYGHDAGLFERTFNRQLANGNVKIHHLASGKDLSAIRFKKGNKDPIKGTYHAKLFENPATGEEIHYQPFRTIGVSF